MDFGPSSLENEDVVVQLDHILADLFKFIDKTVVFENTLIVLSADHGMADMLRDPLWWKCFNSKFIMKIENRGILWDKKFPYSKLNSYSIYCCKPKKEEKNDT